MNEKEILISGDAIARLMKIIEDERTIDKTKFTSWLASEYELSSKKEKKLNFRAATIEKLAEIVNIEQAVDEDKFDEWFSYKYELKKEEEMFLRKLIKDNIIYLSSFNERTLTAKFIVPILNQIEFRDKRVKDWYEYAISCKLNGWILSGFPDFFIATGREEPKRPYFFLQEYKREVKSSGHPKYQVLAAMLAAMTLNKTKTIKGGYIIGRFWNFVILNKLENTLPNKKNDVRYEYFVSKGFDCLDYEDLKKIYSYLQAVKFLYCK